MARQIFEENGASAGSAGNGSGGNANAYITVPVVDVKPILLVGHNAVVKVSASVYDESNRIVKFDLRLNGLQIMLEAVKNGKQWEAEHTFAVVGQSGDRLEIFCNAIDAAGLRSFAGTPQIPPRLTQSVIAAPVITSPLPDEYKTAGSVVMRGTEFVSLGQADTQKAIHGRVVLADDPQIVRWEGSAAGALTQITATWTPAGDGQEDLLCSIAYEGYSGGMGEWSEPVRVKLVKSGVSVPVITWPLNGEKYADPNLLRCNAEQPTIKSGSWTGTEWQVSEYADFSVLHVNQSFTDTDVLPNRVMVDLNLGNKLDKTLYLRCRHLTNVGPTDWSKVTTFQTAPHQTFWELTASSGTFNPPVPGVYEVLCVGKGGAGGVKGTYSGGGGGGSGYLAIGGIHLTSAIVYSIATSSTSMGSIIANAGSSGANGTSVSGIGQVGGDGGNGGNGGGGAGAQSGGGKGGIGASGVTGKNGSSISPWKGGDGGGDGYGIGGNLNIPVCSGKGYGGGIRGQSYDPDKYLGGGGAGGYGGGVSFPTNNYYSKHLPYKNFDHITNNAGYIRVMYKGPTGTESPSEVSA